MVHLPDIRIINIPDEAAAVQIDQKFSVSDD
jgi:hypothetical protein